MDSYSNNILKEEIIEILVEPIVPLDAFDSEDSAEDSDIESNSDLNYEIPNSSYATSNSVFTSENEVDDAVNYLNNSSFCGKQLKNKLLLTKHVKCKHRTDTSQLKCTDCKQLLPTHENYKLHSHNDHKGGELQKKNYSKHIHTNDSARETLNTNHQIEFCKETGKKRVLYKPKEPIKYNKFNKIICSSCEKTFDSKKQLRNHKRVTHPPPEAEVKCIVCDKQFKTKFHLNIHMNAVHDEKQHYCEICHRQYKSRKYFLMHKHINDNASYDCKDCTKSYRSKGELRRHTKKFHIIKQDWSINSTDSSDNKISQNMSKTTEIVKHIKTKTKELTHKCTICEKIFACKENLRDHKRNVHAPPEAAQNCEICQKSFKSIHHLKIHIRHIHDDSLHVCDLCQKEFKSRNYMMKHRRTHIDTQVSCGLCPKVFKCKDNLTKHMKRIHVLPCSFEYDEGGSGGTEDGDLNSNSEDIN